MKKLVRFSKRGLSCSTENNSFLTAGPTSRAGDQNRPSLVRFFMQSRWPQAVISQSHINRALIAMFLSFMITFIWALITQNSEDYLLHFHPQNLDLFHFSYCLASSSWHSCVLIRLISLFSLKVWIQQNRTQSTEIRHCRPESVTAKKTEPHFFSLIW